MVKKESIFSYKKCNFYFMWDISAWDRRDFPVDVPLDLSTPTGMSCIGTYGENCKSDNVSKYRVLLVAFLVLWHENWYHGKIQ